MCASQIYGKNQSFAKLILRHVQDGPCPRSSHLCERFREINTPATIATNKNSKSCDPLLKDQLANAKQRTINQRASEYPIHKLQREPSLRMRLLTSRLARQCQFQPGPSGLTRR